MTSPSSVRKVGFLFPGPRDPAFELWRQEFLDALEEFSWREGNNLHIEWRFAENDRAQYAARVSDPVWAGVDVLVTGGTPLTHLLRQAMPNTPIVTGVGDPVGSGFAISLKKPGFNITGLCWALREKARKQIGLLIDMVPTVKTLLVLRSARYGDISELNTCLVDVAGEHGLTAEIRTAESFAEVEAALESFGGKLTCAAVIYANGAFQFDESAMAGMAIRLGIVAIGDDRRAAEAGCLMIYGTHHASQARSYASFVDRILREESPAQMAFELPDQTEFIINRATAASLGLEVSPELLNRANGVIG